MLEYDSSMRVLTDWSGSLSIDTGCIKVISKILFEPKTDYLVRPRESCRALEWVSYTSTHYDGLLVFLYFRPADADPLTVVNFQAGPYNRSFTLDELESLAEIINIDESGNKVSIEAIKLDRLQCEEGYLEGRWIKTGDPSERGRENRDFDGIFFGRYISKDGLFLGHVKGHWGTRTDGEQVFFGKWINHLGLFRGLLKGTWGFDSTADDTENNGWFQGDIFDATSIKLGTLEGKWVSHHRGSMPISGATDKVPKHARGFFHGMWKQYCN